MTTTDYPPPVDKLLTLGDARGSKSHWPNYLAYGLGPEHIPDLIRMATDKELNGAGSDSLEVWAPVHAWRALGQLRAGAAAEPLTGLLHRIDDDQDDYVGEELPEVYGMIGPAAIPVLAAYLADAAHPLYARVAAAHSFGEIGVNHPGSRAECVAALTAQLERFAETDPTLNAFVISYLMDLNAVESAPVMERAFAAGQVELPVAGDWEDVQIDLGLRQTRTTPKPNYAASIVGPELAAQFAALSERLQSRETLKVATGALDDQYAYGDSSPRGPELRKAKKRDKRKQQESRSKSRKK
jgi:hypothetical protein